MPMTGLQLADHDGIAHIVSKTTSQLAAHAETLWEGKTSLIGCDFDGAAELEVSGRLRLKCLKRVEAEAVAKSCACWSPRTEAAHRRADVALCRRS